jgi:outer membrane protein TolC
MRSGLFPFLGRAREKACGLGSALFLAVAAGCAAAPSGPSRLAASAVAAAPVHPAATRAEAAPAATRPRGPLVLTIEDVRRRARDASERVLEAQALIRKAKAHENATFDETFLPKIDAEGSYLRTDRRLAIETRLGPIQIASRDLGTELVRATQPILDVSGFFFRFGAEREATEAARLAAARAGQVAELEAVRAFYAVLTRRDEIVAIERSVEVLKRRLADAQASVRAGVGKENDVTKVELELARRRQSLLATRNAERGAVLELLALVALPPEASVKIIEPPGAAAPASPPPLPKLVERALEDRPDLRALAVAERRLDMLETAYATDYLPRIEGFVDYRYDLNDVFNDSDAVEAGVQARVRLFDGFARDEKRAEVRAEREALRARRRDLERRVAVEVEQALLAVDERRSALGVAERSITQAESSLRIEEDLEKHAKSTATAVLDAELRLFESRVEAARARYGALEALAWLRAAVGE